jgi:hypothetical protein
MYESHVRHGADDEAGRRHQQRRRVEPRRRARRNVHLGEPEIEHLDEPAPGLDQVGALDVAVDDMVRMRVVESVRQLRADVDRVAHRQRAAADAFGQVLAFDVFHGDEQRAVVLADVVRDGDVRRAQRGRSPRFAHQPRPTLGVLARIGREELERHLPSQPRVLRKIHLAHPACAEAPDDTVMVDGLPFQHSSIVGGSAVRLYRMSARLRAAAAGPGFVEATFSSLTDGHRR